MFAIKRQSLTFKETILDARFDKYEDAKANCSILNRSRDGLYTVIEVEPGEKDLVIVEKDGKRLLVSDIRTAPGAKDWKLTSNPEYAMHCAFFPGRYAEVKKIYEDMGYKVEILEIN